MCASGLELHQGGIGYPNVMGIVQSEGCVRGSVSVWDDSFLALRSVRAQLLML